MYLDNIYDILNKELDYLIKIYNNNKELSHELNSIKTESIKIYNTLTRRNYNKILNKKYQAIYNKILKNIEYIKRQNRDETMIDYLNEIYINILDYSEIILSYEKQRK